MEKSKKIKWFFIVGIFVIFSIISINLYADFTDKDITVEDNIKLITAILTFSGVMLGIVFTNASNKQIDFIKVDIKNIDKRVTNLDSNVKMIDEMMTGFDEKQISMELGLMDISEAIKHKEKIISLSKLIESETNDMFESHFDINIFLKDFLIELTSNISQIIRNQYEYGFNDFNTNFFKRKLLNQLAILSEHTDFSRLNKDIFNIILESINKNICIYINELNLIKNLENGTRRKKFEDLTLKFTNKLVSHSLEIYNNSKIKTA